MRELLERLQCLEERVEKLETPLVPIELGVNVFPAEATPAIKFCLTSIDMMDAARALHAQGAEWFGGVNLNVLFDKNEPSAPLPEGWTCTTAGESFTPDQLADTEWMLMNMHQKPAEALKHQFTVEGIESIIAQAKAEGAREALKLYAEKVADVMDTRGLPAIIAEMRAGGEK